MICTMNGERNIDKPVTPSRSMYQWRLIDFVLKYVDRMTNANSLMGVKDSPMAMLVTKGTLKRMMTKEKATNFNTMHAKNVPPRNNACSARKLGDIIIPIDDRNKATNTVSSWLMFMSVFSAWNVAPIIAPAANAPNSSDTPKTPPRVAIEKQNATEKSLCTSRLHRLCIQLSKAGIINFDRTKQINRNAAR